MKHLRDIDGAIHLEGPDGVDYTLCGHALEGERGDTPMVETNEGIDCDRCIGIINHCRRVRGGQIKPAFKRRRLGAASSTSHKDEP